MSSSRFHSEFAVVLLRPPVAQPATYSLEDAARHAGLHPELLRHYCRLGVFAATSLSPDREPRFDDNALFAMRRFEQHRRRHKLDRNTARLIHHLQCEVERLQAEVRLLRHP